MHTVCFELNIMLQAYQHISYSVKFQITDFKSILPVKKLTMLIETRRSLGFVLSTQSKINT